MRWERLAAVRTLLLILIGIGSIIAAAFIGLGLWAGLLAIGIGALFLEFMTGDRGASEPETGAQRR